MPLNQSYVESRATAGALLAPKAVMLFDDMVHWLDAILQLDGNYNPEIAVALADGAKFIEESADLAYMDVRYLGLRSEVQDLGKVTGGALLQGSAQWLFPDSTTISGAVGGAFATGGVVKSVRTFEIRKVGDTGRWYELRKLPHRLWPQVRRSARVLPDDSTTQVKPTYFWPGVYSVDFESPSDADYDTRVSLTVFTDPFPEGVQAFTPAGFHPLFNEFRGLITAEACVRMVPVVRDQQVAEFWPRQLTKEWAGLHTRLDALREAEVEPPIGFLNWEGSVDA